MVFHRNIINSFINKVEKITDKHFANFNSYGLCKLTCNYNTFYIRQTCKSLKIRYNKHILGIKN